MAHQASSAGRPVIVVAGPTASGKSALASALAQRLDGIVINADAMQVYRELRILTARPTPADEARVPHRLYGVLPALEACSAARWRDMAGREIAAALAQCKRPIVVGGTGLYLRVLMHGLAAVPAVPAAIRSLTRALHQRLGAAAFHARLAERDPVMATRLHPRDSQRLIRAWDVFEATGRSLADWQSDGKAAPLFDFRMLALTPPRQVVYDACNARLLAMLDAGALDEVRRLARLALDPALPIMKAVGLRELLAHVQGRAALDAAVAGAQQATRRYAKRQLTWLRHQIRPEMTFNAQHSSELLGEIVNKIS